MIATKVDLKVASELGGIARLRLRLIFLGICCQIGNSSSQLHLSFFTGPTQKDRRYYV